MEKISQTLQVEIGMAELCSVNVKRLSDTFVFWHTVAHWHCGTAAMWHCGSVAMWFCGTVAVWYCGTIQLWQCGACSLGELQFLASLSHLYLATIACPN